MLDAIEKSLLGTFDKKLVQELLAAHQDAKQNAFLGGLRLSAVEGGRFCEAAFRMLEFAAFGTYTEIGKSLETEKIIGKLAQLPKGAKPDSIRLHIPRALRVVYDIRNNRDAAHLADGIDPNLQDSSLVIGIIDWVLAEFLRLFHVVSADEAQRLVDSIVSRTAPAIENINGFLKVLRPTLQVSDYLLLLLYECGPVGAEYSELEKWVQPKMRANLRRTLNRLSDEVAFIHQNGSKFVLTKSGKLEVEKKRLHNF